jgi:hypothetical protein
MDINEVMTLSDLKPAQHGRVVIIKTKTFYQLQSEIKGGLLLNAFITVVHRDGRHVLFFANDKEVAVDQDIASGIYVRPDE